MTQLSLHPSYQAIEDRLDALSQKLRTIRIVQGAFLFAAAASLLTFAASLLAHFTGQSHATQWVQRVYLLSLLVSFAALFLRPLLMRPKPAQIARLIELKIPNLHNGLTNAILLAKAADLASNPWLPQITDEIQSKIQKTPIAAAIPWSDLRPTLYKSLPILLALIALSTIPSLRNALNHGWRQMFNPTAFVPTTGSVQILSVSPENATLVAGQPLDVTITANDPAHQQPSATLLFDDPQIPTATLSPTPDKDGHLTYASRVDSVSQSMKFRIEIAGAQSPWYPVTVIPKLTLTSLSFTIHPPAYTQLPVKTLNFPTEQIDHAALSVPEGSTVDVTATIDAPVAAAYLQINDNPDPVTMSPAADHFSATLAVNDETRLSIKLAEASQIVAQIPTPPESPIVVSVIKDLPPQIQVQWPAVQDQAIPLNQDLTVKALIHDDYGITSAHLLATTSPSQPLDEVKAAATQTPAGPTTQEFSFTLPIDPDLRKHGQILRLQLQVTDNRDTSSPLHPADKDTDEQTTQSPIYTLTFQDPAALAQQQAQELDQLHALLKQMLDSQTSLHNQTTAWQPATIKPADKTSPLPAIIQGQTDLQAFMQKTADTFKFDADTKIVQKTLQVLATSPAAEAITLAQQITSEPVQSDQVKLSIELEQRQRAIIDTLTLLLAGLNHLGDPTTQPATKPGGDLTSDEKEQFKKLDEALQEFMKEEQRILDQTATLAKKPVDNWDKSDQKLADDLKQAQDKMDAFMQEKVSDFSKLAEQDMANASMLRESMEVFSEVTMAKDALNKQATEVAVPLEESGLELAKELDSNIEKWLANTPDRQQWTMEEPTQKTDPPMAELPKELEDMVGQLMEQQEDLFQEMEDATSSWADSLNKGAGWDAADGPIANMSAQGVTGNQLPNNDEMNGRSGEGRQGKSSGEMVGDTAQGKGGRNTPTRLDPTPFQQGQVNDTSKDPVGGATGGGKLSGQGGQGLEGPLAPKQNDDQLQRLANKQADLRNTAERLELQYQLGKYDNFQLIKATAEMRRVEADVKANRYDNALRRRDVLIDSLSTSQMLLGGQVDVQQDSTPAPNQQIQSQINDATKGDLPAAWSEALKDYYKKVGSE